MTSTSANARRQESELAARVAAIAQKCGYINRGDLKRGKSAKTWAFWRAGASFATEILLLSFVREPDPNLMVEFFGSPHSIDYLATNGLSGNAGGKDLRTHLTYFVGRPASDVLPREVPLIEEERWDDIFRRLEEEIATADQSVWGRLFQQWSASRESAGKVG